MHFKVSARLNCASFTAFSLLCILAAIPAHAGPAASFQVTLPAQVYSGTTASTTITALDASGQIATTCTGTIHFTSSDGAAALPADYTFTLADAGVHSFNVTFNTPGTNQTLTARDTVTTSITGTGATFVQYPPSVARHLRVDEPAVVEHDTPVSFTVTALNAEFQVVTTYDRTIHFIGTTGIDLPPDYTFVPGDHGTHTFTAVFHRGGNAGISASEVGNGVVSGTGSSYVTCSEYHVTAGNTGPACPGQTVTLYATSDHPNVNWYWTGPHGWFSFQQNPSITASTLLAGVYTVEVTDPVNGCMTSAQTTVAIASMTPPPITVPASACPSAHALTASVPDQGSGATYQWTLTGGTITSGQGTRTITFDAGSSNSAQLGITVGANGCSASSAKSIALSAPSVSMTPPPATCSGSVTTIPFALSGTPPFTVRWSDGTVQSGITSTAGTRSVTPTATTTYSIIEVTDASCTAASAATVTVTVTDKPAIVHNPASMTIARNATATLHVDVNTSNVSYQWFEGTSGDTSTPVGTNSATFQTPPLQHTTSYWVRAIGTCGGVASETATITVDSATRHRAARH